MADFVIEYEDDEQNVWTARISGPETAAEAREYIEHFMDGELMTRIISVTRLPNGEPMQ